MFELNSMHIPAVLDNRPEGLGVVCGAVYLMAMFLFIPVPFIRPYFLGEKDTFEHQEVRTHQRASC